MKNSNFKKVLAFVLSLAMILSVCTAGFAVSAETSEVDLNYYLVNDTTEKTWRNANQGLALAKYDGRTVYRISPTAAETGQFGLSSRAELTAEQAASVNSLSYYIANETGVALPINYKYYAGDGSKVANFNGYAYLMDAATGELVPLLVTGGYLNIPAGFKGYVIYDLSVSNRYGNSNLTDANGDILTTVDAVKTNLFKSLSFFPKYTEDMIKKAWYVGDLAVSKLSVEELAKYISGAKVIAYNFNMASERYMDADENMMFWGARYDSDGTADNNAFPKIVDYGTLEGKGSEFTLVSASSANLSSVDIRDSFWASNGTSLPFAIEKAKGMKIDIKKTGNIAFHPCVKGEPNKINGTYYFVSNTGAVTTGTSCAPPANFEGSIYIIFNEENGVGANYNKENYSWEKYVSGINGKFGITLYSSSGAAGDTITFGGFSFIYDVAGVEAVLSNTVFIDGTKQYSGWFMPKNGYTTYGTQWSTFTNVIEDGKTVFIHTDDCKVTKREELLFLNQGGVAAKVSSPENVKAISFELKLSDFKENVNVNLAARLLQDYVYSYVGNYKAISRDGTVVQEVINTPNITVDESGNATYAEKYTAPTFSLPYDFDGIIILEFNQNYVHSKGTAAGTAVQTFEQFIASQNGVLKGLGLYVTDNNWSAFGNDSKFIFDNFRLVGDVDAVIADYTSLAAEAKRVAEEQAKIAAAEKAVLEGVNVVNDFSGVNNNTFYSSNVGTSNVVDTSYVTDENGTQYAGKIKFSTSPASSQRRLSLNVNAGSLDLSDAVGFTYKINVTNPGNYKVENTYQINGQKNSITNPTVYIINDETGEITKGTRFSNNSTFKGTVVVLFDEDVAIIGGYADESTDPKYTMSEFVAAMGSITDIGFWLTDRAVSEKVYAEDGATVTSVVLTEACANFEMEVDDLAFIYDENPIVKELEARYDTEKYFVPINDLTRTTFTEYNSFLNFTGRYSGWTHTAPFTPTIDSSVNNPGGVAYKFTRVEFEETTTREFKIKNRSTLTKDELKEKEAIAYWVKVPEGETLGISKVIGGEADVVQTSLMTYDVVKGETKLIAGGTDLTLSGFEGYVIIPLQNALIGKPGTGYDTNADKVNDLVGPIAYSDFIDAKGISQLYFYMAHGAYKNIATSFWMGEFQFVDSLSKFFAEIGADAKLGDVNGDTVVDIRDTVRLKKYNADATVAIAYNNVDIDYNGFIDTAAELIASRKQVMGVKYKSPEWDSSLEVLPEVMVGFYHGGYGTWDYYASDVADEADVLNAYTSFDMYSLAQLKKSGGAGWMYIHESHGGEPVFGTKDGGYDANSTTLNEAWKVALDATIQNYKDQGVWNQVAGFHTEEMLMDTTTYMTQAQFAVMTKYLRETYGKRVLAVLSVAEVTGSKDGKTPAANAATYANVTDIGFDKYHITTDEEKATFIEIFNAMKTNTGNRTDMKYWLLPTTYCGKTADGAPSRTDESIAAEVEWFASIFADTTLIPESQRGGLLFYTFQTFYDGGYDYPVSAGAYGNFGLDKLLSGDYNYTLTAQAIADFAAKYVK